jgi:hypothetical protein
MNGNQSVGEDTILLRAVDELSRHRLVDWDSYTPVIRWVHRRGVRRALLKLLVWLFVDRLALWVGVHDDVGAGWRIVDVRVVDVLPHVFL